MPAIYLDYNASTPVAPEVLESMLPFLTTGFGNAGSSHAHGRHCRSAIVRAREQVAALLGCAPEEIIFTSGGSEANNLAIKGYLEGHRAAGDHLVTTAIEHPSISEPCRYWQRMRGYRLTFVPVDEYGRVQPYPPGEPILKLATVRDIFELFSARAFVATSRKWQPNGNSANNTVAGIDLLRKALSGQGAVLQRTSDSGGKYAGGRKYQIIKPLAT
ncbi:MAG: aminotransferase class V-fold PLP-dependent enzyme, partial [candidate division KSB1 bacterium]|nr:aminotransferase class V-fold PLP-dependent enzyme [candidate division KSB1 bacterium]MDZ7398349.1 aminotransferase class V-fold PLP-dependent enzyme [candidate division KSB1 bacterium]